MLSDALQSLCKVNTKAVIWVNSTGYFVGTFTQPLFGIPVQEKRSYLRYTEMVLHQDGQILESYLILILLMQWVKLVR